MKVDAKEIVRKLPVTINPYTIKTEKNLFKKRAVLVIGFERKYSDLPLENISGTNPAVAITEMKTKSDISNDTKLK